MTTYVIPLTIDREDILAVLRVSVEYRPGDPARTTGPPELCYPAGPAEWDIVDVVEWIEATWFSAEGKPILSLSNVREGGWFRDLLFFWTPWAGLCGTLVDTDPISRLLPTRARLWLARQSLGEAPNFLQCMGELLVQTMTQAEWRATEEAVDYEVARAQQC